MSCIDLLDLTAWLNVPSIGRGYLSINCMALQPGDACLSMCMFDHLCQYANGSVPVPDGASEISITGSFNRVKNSESCDDL